MLLDCEQDDSLVVDVEGYLRVVLVLVLVLVLLRLCVVLAIRVPRCHNLVPFVT
jgi:hypothetical protein